jgi:hypothetical protein
MLRYTTEKNKAYRILDLTSLSIDEFEQLVVPFEQAFVRHMQQWTMEGKPRSARAYTPYSIPTRLVKRGILCRLLGVGKHSVV